MKKLTLTIVSILSVVAIFGVGFAAWVIINPDVEAPADGTIAVETVEDKSYTLTAAFDKTTDTKNGTISFGAPTSGATSGWLRADSTTDKKEKLTAKLTLTLTYKDWAYVPETLNLSIATRSTKSGAKSTDDETVASQFAAVSTPGENQLVSNTVQLSYTNKGTNETDSATINGGEGSAAEIKTAAFTPSTSNATDTTTDKTATLTVTLTFAWGSYFTLTQESGGTVVNPYTFYSGKDYKTFKDDAKSKLELIQTNLGTDVGYKLTISGATKGINAE